MLKSNLVVIQNPASSKLQGIGGGWHLRTPGEYFGWNHLQYGNSRAETIHYSVHILQRRKLVNKSLGLKHLEEPNDPNPGTYTWKADKRYYLHQEFRTTTEAQLLATWTSRKLLISLVPAFVNVKDKSSLKLKQSNDIVPIFAVLHQPDGWRVERSELKGGYITIHVQGVIRVNNKEWGTMEVSNEDATKGQFDLDKEWHKKNWMSRLVGGVGGDEYLFGNIVVPFRYEGRPENFSAIDPEREVLERDVEDPMRKGKGRVYSDISI
jgi:hypothetical protein